MANFLDELGLTRLWTNKIRPLATLQNDLTVKNPRVTVSNEVKSHTFPAGSNIEDVLNYLYRNVIAEAQPSHSAVLPTITTTCTPASNSAELNTVVSYTVQKGTFSEGTVGTCERPWEETPHQTDMASGSTEKTGTFKIYSGNTNDPAACTTEPTMSGGKVTGSITVSAVGDNNAGVYYCSTTEYVGSTATSLTSYGNAATAVEGKTFFNDGTTVKSNCVTCKVVGYKPAFGNIKLSSSTASDTAIANLGNVINAAGSKEFWYGPVDTTGSNTTSFHIYFPNERSLSKIEWYDEQTRSWVDMTVDVETSSTTFYATLPAGSDTSKYPDQGLATGVAYKEVHVKSAQAWGSRKYRITLA